MHLSARDQVKRIPPVEISRRFGRERSASSTDQYFNRSLVTPGNACTERKLLSDYSGRKFRRVMMPCWCLEQNSRSHLLASAFLLFGERAAAIEARRPQKISAVGMSLRSQNLVRRFKVGAWTLRKYHSS
jgi:hypothetical protein